MIFEDYGWDSWFDDQYKSLNMNLKAGRVVGNSEVYRVVCEDGVIDARISDRLFYATASDSELPVPGDWVLIISDESDSGYSIYDLLPRRSFLSIPDEDNCDEQVSAAANVDYVLAALPAENGLDPATAEMLADVSRDWGAEPLFICYGKPADKNGEEIFKKAAGDAGVIFIDSIDNSGLAKLDEVLSPRKTYAVTGVNADDVSSIISYLTDGEIFSNNTGDDNKGILHVLHSSAILLGIPLHVNIEDFNGNNDADEIEDFQDIIEIASSCRFSDCHHVNEPGCAIREALDSGELDYDYYKAFMKELKKESGRTSVSDQADGKKQRKNAAE